MPITMNDVRAWLDAEEVNYTDAKRLGVAMIPHLMELVQGGDLGLASKAAYLASLIKSKKAAVVVEVAAASQEPILRVAAASGIKNLPVNQAEKILDLLSQDPDAGIRKVVIKSAVHLKSPVALAKIKKMAKSDPEVFIRDLAASTAKRMKKINP